jgi:glutamate dehydrogenase
LFFTQEACLRLEKAGVVIFKDASANKGGVTSSSLEVLTALSFDDEEFDKHMSVKNGVFPEFYDAYVKEVQQFIEHNAALEFEALWREHQLPRLPSLFSLTNFPTLLFIFNHNYKDLVFGIMKLSVLQF